MAMAFGIQYGLDDIRRANEAITRELEQQLAITQRLASESRMITGRSAYSLGSGPAVVTNAQQAERNQEVAVNRIIDRRIRSVGARFAGTSFGSGGVTGHARNVGDLAQLLQGGLSAQNARGSLELLGGAVGGLPGIVGLLGRVAPAAASALGPLAAVAGGAAAIMGGAYSAFATAPQSVWDAVSASNKSFRSLQGAFKGTGYDITSAPMDIGPVRGGEVATPLELTGFNARMQGSARAAERTYDAATMLANASLKASTRYLNLPGYQTKSSVLYYIKQMLAQGEMRHLQSAAMDMKATEKKIQQREAAQAALFENDPMAASRVQEQMRLLKYINDRKAVSLRDWSRS
jgi:hypothetical protein